MKEITMSKSVINAYAASAIDSYLCDMMGMESLPCELMEDIAQFVREYADIILSDEGVMAMKRAERKVVMGLV